MHISLSTFNLSTPIPHSVSSSGSDEDSYSGSPPALITMTDPVTRDANRYELSSDLRSRQSGPAPELPPYPPHHRAYVSSRPSSDNTVNNMAMSWTYEEDRSPSQHSASQVSIHSQHTNYSTNSQRQLERKQKLEPSAVMMLGNLVGLVLYSFSEVESSRTRNLVTRYHSLTYHAVFRMTI